MARQQHQELAATYLAERHRFDGNGGATVIGTAIAKDEAGRPKNIAVKGFVNGEPLVANQSYRFYGFWQAYTNPRTGIAENQFNFKTFVKNSPASRAGVVGYLKSLKIKGLGVAIAGQLFDKFGPDAIKVLRETPEVASAAIPRFPLDKAESAAAILECEKQTEDCKMDLVELFGGRGFRLSLADDCIAEWGNAAAARVRKSPYSLMKFSGVGFKRADKLFLDLSGNPAKLKRQALCIWHAVRSKTNGDTWLTANVAEKDLRESVGGAEPNYAKALRLAIRADLLSATYTDGPHGALNWDGSFQWIAERVNARNERRIAEYVAEAVGQNVMLADAPESTLEVSEHQYEQLEKATLGCLGILGGSPGTGKTYTAAAYIRSVAASIGLNAIAVCAPTGKAAVRITEAMQANGVTTRAKTIHSLLGVMSAGDAGWSFEHGKGNPLPFRLIVVDESSMIDAGLMASLLAARARDAAILFVGDVNQLPPVGSGAPLRDMIAAGVPYGELREIQRNDGGIVQACADIRDGKRFACEGNLRHVPAATPEAVLEKLRSTLNEISTIDDPVWGAQVLVAVNKKSPLARKEINRILQGMFNSEPEIAGSPFRLGDKVVCLKNSFLPAIGPTKALLEKAKVDAKPLDEILTNETGGVYVANGEIGEVVAAAPKYFDVKLASPDRFLRVPRGPAEPTEGDDDDDSNASETGCNWDLAYAISVHKSQGSEFPHVVTLVDEYAGAKRLCLREWWYTAISRAKKQSFLIGDLETAVDGCRKQSIGRRKTFLKELLIEKLSP